MITTCRSIALCVFVLLLLYSRGSDSSPGRLPPVVLATVAGEWEGISDQEPRIFVLKTAGSSNDTSVAMVVGPPGSPKPYVFRALKLSVSAGSVSLVASSEDGMQLDVRLRGSALEYEGTLSGTVTLLVDAQSSRFPVVFYKRRGGYVNGLRDMVQCGRNAL